MQKILKKFMKNFFELPDNVIDKKLLAFIESKSFSHRSDLQHTIDDLRYFFAYNFTNGSDSKARNILEAHHRQIRKKDLVIGTFFGGASIVMTLFGIFFTFVTSYDKRENMEAIGEIMPIYRFVLFCVYLVFAAGLCTSIYTKYEINYLYIFQIDPNHKMTPWQLYKISVILYFIFITFYTMNMIEIKLDYAFDDNNTPYFVLALIVALLIYCL